MKIALIEDKLFKGYYCGDDLPFSTTELAIDYVDLDEALFDIQEILNSWDFTGYVSLIIVASEGELS